MSVALTAPQSRLLGVIRRLCDERGIPPTVAEIRDAEGARSNHWVLCRISKLEDAGLVRRRYGSARGVTPVGWSPPAPPRPASPPGRLTDRQAEALAFIERFIAKHGISPSFREIAKELSPHAPHAVNGAHQARMLARKGYIAYEPRVARSIRVLVPSTEAVF